MHRPVGSPDQVSNEINVDPLGDIMLDYLIGHDDEESFLDFKEIIDISKRSPFPKLAKDIFAFANYGGGWILIGFKRRQRNPEEDGPRRNYELVGLPDSYSVDGADLQNKFNAYCSTPITLRHHEFYR